MASGRRYLVLFLVSHCIGPRSALLNETVAYGLCSDKNTHVTPLKHISTVNGHGDGELLLFRLTRSIFTAHYINKS